MVSWGVVLSVLERSEIVSRSGLTGIACDNWSFSVEKKFDRSVELRVLKYVDPSAVSRKTPVTGPI